MANSERLALEKAGIPQWPCVIGLILYRVYCAINHSLRLTDLQESTSQVVEATCDIVFLISGIQMAESSEQDKRADLCIISTHLNPSFCIVNKWTGHQFSQDTLVKFGLVANVGHLDPIILQCYGGKGSLILRIGNGRLEIRVYTGGIAIVGRSGHIAQVIVDDVAARKYLSATIGVTSVSSA